MLENILEGASAFKPARTSPAIHHLAMAPPFSFRTELRIKAPAAKVWEILIDTSTWPEWNSFIPLAEDLDVGPGAPEDGPRIFSLGSRRRFHANMGGKTSIIMQKVTKFETPDDNANGPRIYRICWSSQGYPDFIFNTNRWNEVEEVNGDQGPECIYRTGEDQHGPLAYVVKLAVGKQVEKGLQDWANDLKAIAESSGSKRDD